MKLIWFSRFLFLDLVIYLFKFNYFEVRIEILKIGIVLFSFFEWKVMLFVFGIWVWEKYENNLKVLNKLNFVGFGYCLWK